LGRASELNRYHFKKRRQCWQILELLTDDLDPTLEDETEYGGKRDPANYSINTTRGEAMHAVVSYALWVYRNTTQEIDTAEYSMRTFDRMPEVRSVLDKHLDPTVDSSAAIRSIYGQWFPWLVPRSHLGHDQRTKDLFIQ
jgi:hypothetical protein